MTRPKLVKRTVQGQYRAAIAEVLRQMSDDLEGRYVEVMRTFANGIEREPAVIGPLPLPSTILTAGARMAELAGDVEGIAHELRTIADRFAPRDATTRRRHVA